MSKTDGTRLVWEECLAVLIYNAQKEGTIAYPAQRLHAMLSECTGRTTSWWSFKLSNIEAALGTGRLSAHEIIMTRIRNVAALARSNPNEVKDGAMRALLHPMDSMLSVSVFGNESALDLSLFCPAQQTADSGLRSTTEGERRLRIHFNRERSSRIVEAAKAEFRKNKSGAMFCEACLLDTEAKWGTDLIEAHHKQPLSTSNEVRTTTVHDFTMLCPTCHRHIHKLACRFDRLLRTLNRVNARIDNAAFAHASMKSRWPSESTARMA